MDIFNQIQTTNSASPLSERLRPQNFDCFSVNKSQRAHLQTILENIRKHNFLPNLILWGPPGTGKTTFAFLLSREIKAKFLMCNAIDTGAKTLKEIGAEAQLHRLQYQEKTMLFVDEIHRLNKAQQDVLLPFTEKGDLILIGATTENPGYELTAALLSRSRVVVFEPIEKDGLFQILERAVQSYGESVNSILSGEAQEALLQFAKGDARLLLNHLELLFHEIKNQKFELPIQESEIHNLLKSQVVRYDKDGDEHYNLISAYIKSVRGSDPDAAIYYLARMLRGGEDPIFIARRLVILASEDIGNADPKALPLAVAGLHAAELVGLPEARINLAQVTTYLASAPKSNRSYLALEKALSLVDETGPLPVPISLRSAQTKLAKDLGYGRDYLYSHESPRGYIEQTFLPQEIKEKKFYEPTQNGFEKNILQYLNWLKGKMNS